MSFLTKEAILKSDDLVTEEVEVPEWGGKVLVRTFQGTQKDKFEQKIMTSPGESVDMEGMRALLISLTVVDEDGNLIFDNNGDVEALGKKSALALDRVFDVAKRLNALTNADVEELGKNSEPDPKEDSTSG